MKIDNKIMIVSVVMLFGSVSNIAMANVSETIGGGVEKIEIINDNNNIRYINANYWLDGKEEPPTLLKIKSDVLKSGYSYLVDFTNIYNEDERYNLKELLKGRLGFSVSSDMFIISEYKNELMYTIIDNEIDMGVGLLEEKYPQFNKIRNSNLFMGASDSRKKEINQNSVELVRERVISNESGTNVLPHISFYLNVNRLITEDECTFRNSYFWGEESRNFCDNPNISLIFRVTIERSLQYGTIGGVTPDAKIVRISLDDDTGGTGIHLNDRLDYRTSKAGYKTLVGYFRDWSTDAIAQDYQFVFDASNDKAQILKTYPRENLNKEFTHREVSGFELGVGASAEAGKGGPKAKLEASASYSQSRWLTYNTSDYRVERSSNNPQHVSFKWNRDQYATAKSILKHSTNPLWENKYPVDTRKINPIGYASFVPKMDVIYKANSDVTGTTEFTIDSSVNIRPIYNAAYKHYYVIGAHQSYRGLEDSSRRRVGKVTSFTVDWDHPVFTGGRPVNLQLGSFNNRCINANVEGFLSNKTCEETSSSQSFIYDHLGRYVSAINTRLCIDGQLLNQLQKCNSSLSQRWEWASNGDELNNIETYKILGHNKKTGDLGLYFTEQEEVSTRTLTSYTNVFGPKHDTPVFGDAVGDIFIQNIDESGQLYIKHGAAIDSIGTKPTAMAGGTGGDYLTEIDLNRVATISVISGEFKYGGRHLLAIKFTYDDGSLKLVGSTDYAVSSYEETFDLSSGSSISQVKVWTNGWLVEGIQFNLN
ncbi:leukocidin family pore-forming toxin [Vibrio lamellibrachiae]|uniref:leukocidin family pore-forming toxin n=1 Tax=Vibrio lamellibrachiae TaxID=2910253 RepID=UPI003D140585